MGANSHGQLGQGITSEQCEIPNPIESTWDGEIKAISCGGGHTLLINDEGKLYACGWNHKRQLGLEVEHCNVFTRVWDLSGIIFNTICTGWDSSAAITDKNVLYLWGSNAYGQLGLPRDDFPQSVKPIQLELKTKSISMGLRHTVLLDINGNVWSTGCGSKGQLGLGEELTSLDRFQKIECITKIEDIACGQHHTLAWSPKQKILYAWGDNTHGQLGIATKSLKVFSPVQVDIFKESSISHIHVGWTNSAVLLDNGKAILWGRNNFGQLGCQVTPECGYHVLSIKERTISQLNTGSEHGICLSSNNTVWSWGWNEHGNCGIGTLEDVKSPQKIDFNFGRIVFIAAGAGHNFVISKSPNDVMKKKSVDGKEI